MGFLPVNPLVCFAERADLLFDGLHEIKDHSLLVVTGMEAYGAEFAYFCQGSVKGCGSGVHSSFFPMEKALASSGPTE
jgi:hypothetical protein